MLDSVFTRDMGYSKNDFLRVLPRAIRDYDHIVEGDQVKISNSKNKHKLILTLSALPNRVLGNIIIERVDVKFEFIDFSAKQQTEFMLQFDRGYRRGGG